MGKRSNLIVTIGLAVFIIGAGATYFVVRDKGSGNTTASGGASVLYAAKAIPAGTAGADAVDQGWVKSRAVDPTARPSTALTDTSQLAGKNASTEVAAGAVLTADDFPQAQTGIGTVKIPAGMTALAVQMANVPGVAGFVAPHDRVDIFGLTKPDLGPPGGSAKLILQNTEVLSVNGGAATANVNAGQPGSADRVFLLAVTPTQAERLVYLTTFQQLYFSLVAKDQAAVPATPGSGLPEALKQLS